MLTEFRDLGTGVGLRPAHYRQFLDSKPESVSWVEVISENYLHWENRTIDRPIQILEKIRQNVPIALHGVSLSIGSADFTNLSYLKRLKDLTSRIQPVWISDHLCWTGVDGENLHDLLPIPYTEEALNWVVKKIIQTQDFLDRRILIENVSSYLEFSESEMSEWEFLSEVVQRADCGILLDVNNVYVSSVNHNFDPIEYLKKIPSHRVGQVHLAGHSNQGNHLIDTHSEPVCEQVWDLYRWTLKHIGLISTMIERDANIPEWEILEEEVKKISQIREEYHGAKGLIEPTEAI